MKCYTAFAVWFIVLSVPLSYMMGTHSLSLKPSKSETLKSLIVNKNSNEKWSKLHFLGSDCACSENVYQTLLKRIPDKNINEQIFVIGKQDSWIKNLKAKGYQVQSGSMEEFEKKYSITAVPQLSIFDNNQKILYSGGYTTKRGPASAVEDELIVKEIKEKKGTSERPIFGCINGSINRKNTDPLGIKY